MQVFHQKLHKVKFVFFTRHYHADVTIGVVNDANCPYD